MSGKVECLLQLSYVLQVESMIHSIVLFCFADDFKAKGVTTNKKYEGCMRNLVSRDPGSNARRLSLANPLMMEGNVYLGGCPYKNVEPLLP